ncbi:MAG TPA: hypothetical protein VHO01_14030 [Jatrophihabitans sp.]|nr:hypothetical protein [Jatrophihabitans sp.]
MTTTDWILDIALLAIVFRQIRESRVDARFVLIPLALVGYFATKYLHALPTAGNDLVLITTLVAIGAALGIAGGLVTRVRYDGTHALVRAGWLAVVLWVVGMGSRMAFQIYVSHGGGPAVGRFSIEHHITTDQAWVTAFVLMAFTEVATRVGTLVWRAYLVRRRTQPVTPVRTLTAA